MFVIVLLVGTVSAFNFELNDRLTYSNNNLKISLDNWWGLGANIGTAELKSHSSVDEILKFGFGKEEVVMYYDFNFVELYENGLGEVTFTNMTNGQKIKKDYYFVQWVVKDVIIDDWDNIEIGRTKNSSIIWERQIVGNHLEQKGSWERLVDRNIPKGKVRIGLKTFVNKDDTIDGEWTIAGKKVKKHSVWTASLNANLISYWTLNGTSGDVVDSLGNATGTNVNGTTRGVTGIINNSFDFELSSSNFVEVGSNEIFDFQGFTEFSVQAWVDVETGTDTHWIFAHDKNPTQQYAMGIINNKMNVEGGGAILGNITIGTGFTHLVWVFGSGLTETYVNGTFDANRTRLSIADGTDTPANIGRRQFITFQQFFDGKIDEVGIWNRTLSSSEVSDLYNNGTAITFLGTFGPAITLNSPVNSFNSTSQTINFNGTIDSSGAVNVTLFIDGILNETNSSGIDNVDYLFTKNISDGDHNWTYESCDSDFCTTATTRTFTIDTSPTINVFSPTNTTFSTSVIFFNATNSTQSVDKWIVNYNGTNVTLSDINTTLTVEDGTDFNLLLYANNSITGVFGLNDSIFFTVDTNAPTLNVTEPFGVVNFQDISINQTLRFNVSDILLNTCTLQYEGSNTTVDCTTNITNFTIGTDRTLTFFANDTVGNLASQVVNWSYLVLQTSTTFNSSDFQTASQRFTVNVTTNGSAIDSGSLTYNGIENTGGTITNPAGNNYSITKVISLPVIEGSATHNFNLTIFSKIINTTLQTQVVNATEFVVCNSSISVPYINISFRNETLALENITATTTATFTFSLSALSGVNKTLTFTNATENPSYAFCADPSDRNLNIDLLMTYNNVISQQRSFSLITALSNVTLNQVLFLLPTTDGLFSPFITVTTLGVAIADVKATISRVIGGTTITITSGFTDGSGFITFFLDPDESYTGVFSKSEFITQTFSFTPNADLRTVTLARTTEAVTNGSEITLNTTYQITPINTTLINNTNVTFGFNVTSEQTITFMSLNITNSTGSELGFISSTTQGFISVVVDTGNNTKLIGTFLFNTSDESITITRIWLVGNFFLGDYSIFNQLILTVDNELISEFFRFLLIIFTITGTIIFLTTREITDTSESKIIVITLLIWAFSLVGWLDTGIFVPDSGEQINQLAQSSNQFGIAILTTIFTVFFISRRIFIRRP